MDFPQLNREFIENLSAGDLPANVHLPPPGVFDLPERVLQFGSGGFLRGFFDYFVDQANRQGQFNGRVVVVQSTSGRRAQIMKDQDGLYTICIQGIRRGQPAEEFIISSAISQAISAGENWAAVLRVAENPDLAIIVSNTTEVGLAYDPDDRFAANPPRSFPGKLTAALFRRFQALGGDAGRGVVILPCELLENNGAVLRDIVLRLAEQWQLGAAFQEWLLTANCFCNTLVDRIVPGAPEKEDWARIQTHLGYRDDLLTIAEVYSLFAIEGRSDLAARLEFCAANPPIIVAEDISPYRERKLRLLNATHTVSVPLAHLCGLRFVIDMMNDPLMSQFVEGVMRQEIAPCLEMDAAVVTDYIDLVLDRFRNPFLKHALLDITLQSTMKMRYRVLPLLETYCRKLGKLPPLMCVGFAAYLRFMKPEIAENGKFRGKIGDRQYPINDDAAAFYRQAYEKLHPEEAGSVREFVRYVGAATALWGSDLTALPGFVDTVAAALQKFFLQTPPALVREMLAS